MINPRIGAGGLTVALCHEPTANVKKGGFFMTINWNDRPDWLKNEEASGGTAFFPGGSAVWNNNAGTAWFFLNYPPTIWVGDMPAHIEKAIAYRLSIYEDIATAKIPGLVEGDKELNFGKRPDVRKRRMEIYNRREQIINGKLTVKMLSEEYTQTMRTIEEDLRQVGIVRK